MVYCKWNLVDFQAQKFDINENPKLIRNFEQIVSNIESKNEQVVDVRDREEFSKVVDGVENRIPNTLNIPYNEFFDKENGTLKSQDQLKERNLGVLSRFQLEFQFKHSILK